MNMAVINNVLEYGDLREFVRESNRIEGITREPTDAEIEAHEVFCALQSVAIKDLQAFVSIIAPDHVLRSEEGNNVRVGRYIAPAGGAQIPRALNDILRHANLRGGLKAERGDSAHLVHCRYEKLHPFSDGNGRSGRVLWLWMRWNHAPLGFLHHFYYEALANFPANA